MKKRPLTAIDFYKADHRRQYPEGTELVYSNLTARSAKLSQIHLSNFTGKTVFFGLQYFIKEFLIQTWDVGFFKRPKQEVVAEYQRRMDNALGRGAITVEHISELHDLGYLPIKIRALKEGQLVPIGVPYLTIENTHPKFFWLTNYLESVMSAYLWKPITSATVAYHYRLLIDDYANKTGAPLEFSQFQGHDFSFRGMSGLEDAALSGAGHLLSFVGTDTVPAIDFLEDYYGANSDSELVGCSVPATEHSVMCMGQKDSEIDTIRRLLKLYPKGIVSIVSDTWDFWKVITEYAAVLRDDIIARPGKVVFRPDSGDPVKIICGDPDAEPGSPEYFGAVRCLANIFGYTVNAKGYGVLNDHVGLIYGDSITFTRANEILAQLQSIGFASNNIVFGIGSYTYQYCTRDTFGMAVKSTYGVVKGEGRMIFKDPITDATKMKKSAKGLIAVVQNANKELVLVDQLPDNSLACRSKIGDTLEIVFMKGILTRFQTLSEIREILRSQSK